MEISAGNLHLGIDLIPIFEESRKGLVDICYPNYDNPYDKIFHNKLVFQELDNGDLLAIDLEKESYGKVVYLSHDGSDLHGYVMANSFAEFLEEYTKLGCVGERIGSGKCLQTIIQHLLTALVKMQKSGLNLCVS